jgi:hypothetical protein
MTSKAALPASFDFQPGRGYDFAYLNQDQINFVISGMQTRLRISTRGDLFTIVSETNEDEFELCSGTYDQIGERFRLITERVFPSGRSKDRLRSRRLLLGISAAAMLVFLFGASYLVHPIINGTDSPIVAGHDASLDDLRMLREFLLNREAAADAAGKLANLGVQSPGQPTTGAPVTDGNNALGVPGYRADLYNDDKPVQTSPVAKTPNSQVVTATPLGSTAAPAAVTQPVPVQSEAKPAEAPASTGDVAALKDKVTSQLKNSNLTKEQAEKALREISMLTPAQLKGASLDNLPPEVRQMLLDEMQQDGNANDQAAPKDTVQDGVPTKLIMLPEQVIDTYRGHDGIASLPENSSWQARGNPAVRLPLPGGGDIKSVEDLKAFGVQP